MNDENPNTFQRGPTEHVLWTALLMTMEPRMVKLKQE